ncbi:MAG TPA: sugar transferase [Aggregatilineaceae bacterium]|nr:sugar transferase [Aggregatilineaceae bacterium]
MKPRHWIRTIIFGAVLTGSLVMLLRLTTRPLLSRLRFSAPVLPRLDVERWMTRRVKRGMDIGLALFGLIVTAPFMLIMAALIRLTMGTPILLRRERPGLQGTPFRMFKFRTMIDARDQFGNLLPADQRRTRLGRWLRRLCLDELPELYNVLRGDMSLVGPRPVLMNYSYVREQARWRDIKPGVTGWAQINGRRAVSWEKRFALDLEYMNNFSIWTDIKIILMTIWRIIRLEEMRESGQAAMTKFVSLSQAKKKVA